MTSPFTAVARELHELGYSVVPVMPGEKKPGMFWRGVGWRPMSDWTKYAAQLPENDTLTKWEQWPDANIGLVLGELSGVVALDFDNCEELWNDVLALIPETPVIKCGAKGFTAFYRWNGERNRSWRHDRLTVLDLLSTGRQTIIPPSIHAETRLAYRWEGEGILAVARADLPVLPDGIVESITAILEPEVAAQKSALTTDSPTRSIDMVRRMLDFCDPCGPRDYWLRIGLAIHAEFSDDRGLSAWREWSSRAGGTVRNGRPLFKEGECERNWRGFKPDGGVTLGTLAVYAKQGGFRDWSFDEERTLSQISGEIEIKPRETIIVETDEQLPAMPPSVNVPSDVIAAAPGLVGAIAKWILETAVVPQPVLALGAALAFVGAVKGKRVRTRTNLRTNLYVLGLGGSGSGKNHPIDALQFLHMHVYGSQSGLLLDRPRSDAGLISGMSDKDGRCLLLWDEIGQEIRAMASEHSSPHRSGIMTVFTEAFSSAGRVLQGQQLASSNRPSINQPCLCVYGTTVPERFFESLNAESVIDGFLSRWLVFQCEDDLPDESDTAELTTPPAWLVSRLKGIDEARPRNGLDLDTPPKVAYSEAGERMYREIKTEFREKARKAIQDCVTAVPIWIRAAEHVAKVALIVTDGGETTERELGWAKSLVDAQCRNMVHLVETRISQNEQEKNTKRVLRHVREAGAKGIAKSKLTKLTFDLRKRERDEILDSLEESGCIREVPSSVPGEKTTGRPAKLYRFIKGV